MTKYIITVEGGKITQKQNFLDRNVKENRCIYEMEMNLAKPMNLNKSIISFQKVTILQKKINFSQ